MTTMNKNGGIAATWIQGRSNEDTTPLPNMRGYLECDEAADNLIVTDDGDMRGTITKVGVKDHTTSIVATYGFQHYRNSGSIAVSPDLRYAAFDSDFLQMEQDQQPNGLKLLPVGHSKFRLGHSLQWSADSSFLFNVMILRDDPKRPGLHQEAIQIVDVHAGKDTTSNLPRGTWFESGILLHNGREVLLFLRPSQNDIKSDPGSVFACEVASAVSCRPIVRDVDDVSFSKDGKIASVKEIFKDPNRRFDGDAIIVPIAFTAEIRTWDGDLIASQRFTRKNEELSLEVKLSPTGKEAAVIWGEWHEATGQPGQSGYIVSLP